MKILKETLNYFVLCSLLMLSVVLFAKKAFAQEDTGVEVIENESTEVSLEENSADKKVLADDEPNDGTVEVIYAPELLAPFSERRGDWSLMAGISVDQFFPDKYRSGIDNLSYEQIFGSDPIKLIQFEMGPKYNTSIGALGANFIAGYGDTSGTLTGQQRQLKMTKIGVSGTYTLDTLFEEPYVAPYISGQVLMFNWEESAPTSGISVSGDTSASFAVTVGALIQLNWIEPVASLQSQNEVGLQNTFLDLFISQYNTSDSATDPNFETAMNFGGGIKLEF